MELLSPWKLKAEKRCNIFRLSVIEQFIQLVQCSPRRYDWKPFAVHQLPIFRITHHYLRGYINFFVISILLSFYISLMPYTKSLLHQKKCVIELSGTKKKKEQQNFLWKWKRSCKNERASRSNRKIQFFILINLFIAPVFGIAYTHIDINMIHAKTSIKSSLTNFTLLFYLVCQGEP